MTPNRPVFISVMQYEDALNSGARSVFDVLETARRLEVDGVELRRETWPNLDDEMENARRRSEELGLQLIYATQATLFDPSADGQSTLRADIAVAKKLGAPQVRFFPGRVPDADDDAAWAVARDVVDYAAERDVVIALENYARTPGGTLAEIEAVLDRLQTPALMVNLDIGNYYLHGQDILAAIRALADRIVSAHIKDQTGIPGDPPTVLGAGVMPLETIFAALDALPQPVIYCFEFRGGDDPEGRIEEGLAYLRRRGGG